MTMSEQAARALQQEQTLKRASLAVTSDFPRFRKAWLLSTAMRRRVFNQDELPTLLGVVRQGVPLGNYSEAKN